MVVSARKKRRVCHVTYSHVDITPQTEGSRVVMMLLIVISLAVLPGLLADVLTTVRKRNGNYIRISPCFLYMHSVDWGDSVSESAKPFILLVGSFRPEQVTEILEGFLNTVI